MNTSRILRLSAASLAIFILVTCTSQPATVNSSPWVRATLKKLTLRQKISQMMVYSMSLDYMSAESARWQEIEGLLETDGIGFIHVWGGETASALTLLNQMQSQSMVPIMVQADLEYGVQKRFGAGTQLPWPMALAATGDPNMAFEAGRITAEEGRALGIHLALAPVVDVNNNPNNPIINTRAFSEDPDEVSLYAISFMRGLQSQGMLATAKHYPGHGDTQTDSHISLAKIPSDSARLWDVELKPFQAIIDAGVELVMVGHLDAGEFQMEPGIPSSLSPYWLHDILRLKQGFKGAIITDAMAMGGITRNFPDRYALIQTIKAGSDIIIQNRNYKGSVDWVEEAVKDGLISESRIDESVVRILTLKQKLGLDKKKTLSLSDMQSRLGNIHNKAVAQDIMSKAVTLVRDNQHLVPVSMTDSQQVYIVDIRDWAHDHDQSTVMNELQRALPNSSSWILDNTDDGFTYDQVLGSIPDSARVIVNIFSRTKMNKDRVLLPPLQSAFIDSLSDKTPHLIVTSFGTPYLIRAFPDIPTYLVTYSDQTEMQRALARAVLGKADITGRLPITIPGIAEHGDGLIRAGLSTSSVKTKVKPKFPPPILQHVAPEDIGADPGKIMPFVNQALEENAWPGGVLLAAKDGKIFMHEYFGEHTYDSERHTYRGDIFDLASVTKVIATTSAAMKLYEEGKLNLDTTVVSYLSEFAGPDSTNDSLKQTITVRNLLTHTAGMRPFKQFFRMNAPSREALVDSVLQSELDTLPGTKYMYSDIGLITLGKVIEKLAGADLKTFTDSVIFRPLAMNATGYLPKERIDRIVPTEISELDSMLVHGFVHDENSHSLGGITGHAGLFSTAIDLARFAQMMLNKGSLGDTVIFKPETIELFTRRANMLEDEENSRCLGWDSPSETSSGGVYLSANSFGHTGFTGTSIWIDPDNQIFVILLTNAVHPHRRYKYPNYFDWRQRVHSAVYESLGFTEITEGLEWRDRWIKEERRRNSWWYKLFH
ncbi:MAG: serine hydrolase [Candidatus Marinimicrobia bacterium]|nr:serine hydrolase [Candidatus Neomarinimicrobiota bacterium]